MKMLSACWLLMIIITICSCRNTAEKKSSINDSLSAAELADPQLKLLTERINADPNDPENYFLRSAAFLQNNNLPAAFRDLSTAIALDSTNLKYYFAMADLSLRGGSAEAAAKDFRRVLERDPQNMEAIIKLSKVYFYDKDYTNSLSMLMKAEEVDPSNAEIWFVRGLNMKEMGDTSRAITSFQKAVAMKSDFYDAYIQLGLLHLNRPGEIAARYFDNAIRLDSLNAEAYYDKAKFYQDRGERAWAGRRPAEAHANYQAAKAVYRQLIAVNPQYEFAYFNTGFICLRQDSLEQGYRMFDFAIKVNPQYAEAYYYRGLVSLEKGNEDAALSDFRQALVLKPDYEPAKRAIEETSGSK
jgi:tetratricopeptide (TPR) repeat protein